MVAPELQADNSSSKLSKIVLHSLGSLQRRSMRRDQTPLLVLGADTGAGRKLFSINTCTRT